MAYGSVLTDVVQGSTAGTPPQFNDGNGTQVGTLCRAWVQFAGASGTRNGNFNVSSVTRNATGYYTVNFTNALSDANYSTVASASASSGGNIPVIDAFGTNSGSYYQAPTTTSCTVYTTNLSATAIDPVYVTVSIFR